MDFTERLEQLRQNTEASNGLLEGTRLVVAMGSRLTLSLCVSAIKPGAQLVGAVTGEADALERLERHQADLLLCTDHLERGNGGSLVAAAKRLRPRLRTLLIVTQPRRTALIDQALEAGCDGLCLEGNIGMGTVLQALTCVDLGAAYIDRDLRPGQLQGWAGLDGQPLAPLTPREREVLTLMRHSLNNQEIAQRLVISPETVKSHVQRILTKLQARDRLQAVLQGIRLGLVEWPEPG